MRRENMASKRCSVRIAHDHVRVNHGLSLIERNITAHSNNLVLAVDGNFLVHFAVGIEVSQGRTVQRADRGEVRARNVILFGELQKSRKSLVSLVKMTAYCLVGSPGLSNSTFMLGALPFGTASEGATYSFAGCREYAANPTIPTINRNTLPNTFMLIMTLSSDTENLCSQPY